MEYAQFHSESLLRSVQGDKIGPLSVEIGVPANSANSVGDSDPNNSGSAGGSPITGSESSQNNGGNSNNTAGESTIECASDPNCITMEELARHNTASDCWIGLHGNVYDLTDYAQNHPGGARVVTNLAGIDGTLEYEIFHSQGLLALVEGTLVGRLDESSAIPSSEPSGAPRSESSSVPSSTPSSEPSVVPNSLHSTDPSSAPSSDPWGWVGAFSGSAEPSDSGRSSAMSSSEPSVAPSSKANYIPSSMVPSSEPSVESSSLPSTRLSSLPSSDCADDPECITMDELARHNTATDCWTGLYGNVYDLTDYSNSHPGGARVITNLAGIDGTSEYQIFHSQGLLALVQGTLVGRLE
jgi:cytochrome b involved in lipid metabolism